MHLTHKERKSVVVERFIRTLKNNIYKYMTSVTKNVHIYKLDVIVNKYNNMYHSTIKIKHTDVKSNTLTAGKRNLLKKFIIKILNLKLVILLEYGNIKRLHSKLVSRNFCD